MIKNKKRAIPNFFYSIGSGWRNQLDMWKVYTSG